MVLCNAGRNQFRQLSWSALSGLWPGLWVSTVSVRMMMWRLVSWYTCIIKCCKGSADTHALLSVVKGQLIHMNTCIMKWPPVTQLSDTCFLPCHRQLVCAGWQGNISSSFTSELNVTLKQSPVFSRIKIDLLLSSHTFQTATGPSTSPGWMYLSSTTRSRPFKITTVLW